LIRHAGLVALRLDGRWVGALIEGPSGSGKSDLALRALDAGFRLVADDRTLVWTSAGAVYGRAPDPLTGLIEARGIGILSAPPIWIAQIQLVISCVGADAEIERLPDPSTHTLSGIPVQSLRLRASEASAPAKIRRAMEHLGRGPQQAYLATSFGGTDDRAGTGDTF
jgi:serine kinase of HPr protein (carbohydrate metabolism regulator)